MSNLVVRGLDTEGSLVTTGLGQSLVAAILQAVSGILTMFGSLSAVFIAASGATDAQKNQGGTAIGIDLGVD